MQINPIIILAYTTTLIFRDRIVAMSSSSVIASLSLLCFLSLFSLSAFARPATFLQDFHVTWSDSHIRQIDGGRAIQLVLDQNSGKKPFNYYIFWSTYYIIFYLLIILIILTTKFGTTFQVVALPPKTSTCLGVWAWRSSSFPETLPELSPLSM